jgi:Uma2 family endonuclease
MTATAKPFTSLESGDRLTRDEFHRRYCARPDIKKAELVKGVVYVPSPARFGAHGKHTGAMTLWLGTYAAAVAGVEFADNTTVILGPTTEVQPDVILFRTGSPTASARISADDYIEGAPDLVVEVAASSVSYDLHDKMDAYRDAGVPEYIVWRVLDGAIDCFELRGGVYVRREPDDRGVIESRGFPGLRLNVAAMLAGNNAAVLAELSAPA